MNGRQIFKRNYFSSPRTLNRCKWSRVVVLVFVPLLTNLLHCNQVAFFVHVFDVYGASVEFSFWFLQENKLFFLLSLVIEPRPVFSRVFVPMRSAYRVVTTVLMKFNCRRKKGAFVVLPDAPAVCIGRRERRKQVSLSAHGFRTWHFVLNFQFQNFVSAEIVASPQPPLFRQSKQNLAWKRRLWKT